MRTGKSLTASEGVHRLQTALHAKAKEAPGFRFYSLSDKVWRDDVFAVAWQAVRRNGGAAGRAIAPHKAPGATCPMGVTKEHEPRTSQDGPDQPRKAGGRRRTIASHVLVKTGYTLGRYFCSSV